jgi:hypothetical protein
MPLIVDEGLTGVIWTDGVVEALHYVEEETLSPTTPNTTRGVWRVP